MIAGVSFASGLLLWMAWIRPHVARERRTVVTGANWGLSAWGDWQTCWEMGRQSKDSKARALSTAFLLTQIGFVAGLILVFCGV